MAATAMANEKPRAQRAPAAIQPIWLEALTTDAGDNSSYLANKHRTFQSTEAELINGIFEDAQLEAELRQQYMQLVIANENREHHDLSSLETGQARADSERDFARKVFAEARNYHVTQQREKIYRKAGRMEALRPIRRPDEIAAGLVAVYQGNPVDVDAPLDTHLRFQMNAPENDEKYKIGVSRGLPVWDLTSGLGFGSTTRTLTASVGKQLTANLRAEVGSSRRIDSGEPSSIAKLNYEIRF
jgi:hypothetical protein